MLCFIKIVAYKKNLGAGLGFIVYYSEDYDVAPKFFFSNTGIITPATVNAVSRELSAVSTIHRLPQPWRAILPKIFLSKMPISNDD